MIRKTLFWCHLSLGVLSAVPVAAMALTGLLLAFQPQILALSERGARSVQLPSSATPLPLDVVVADAAGPLAPKVTSLTISSAPAAAVELRAGRDATLWADPWTGTLTGRSGAVHAAMKQIESLHRWLGHRGIGGIVTGISVLACLVLSLTGLVLWWPRSLKSLAGVLLPRRGLAGRARDWQWHNAVGLLVLPLFVLLSSTGTVMSWKWAEAALYASVGGEPPRRPVQAKVAENPRGTAGGTETERQRPPPKSWQAWFDTVAAHAPSGWERIVLQAPEGQKGASATVLLPGQGKRQASSIQLDVDGAFREFKPGRTDAGARLRDLIRPLHTGELFGLAGQILMTLTTIGVLLLVWTGTALSWRRLGRWRSRRT